VYDTVRVLVDAKLIVALVVFLPTAVPELSYRPNSLIALDDACVSLLAHDAANTMYGGEAELEFEIPTLKVCDAKLFCNAVCVLVSAAADVPR
jgi:hypothetical protein